MDIFEPRKITYYLDSAGLIQAITRRRDGTVATLPRSPSPISTTHRARHRKGQPAGNSVFSGRSIRRLLMERTAASIGNGLHAPPQARENGSRTPSPRSQ